MRIYRYESTIVEQEIKSPSYYKYDWDYECGETMYFIKVEVGIKREVMIQEDEGRTFCHISKEEWSGYEDQSFKWKDSDENEFNEKMNYALNNL